MRPVISPSSATARAALLIAAGLSVVAALPAAAADMPAAAPRTAAVGPCADAGVLASIRHRFAYGAARVEKRELGIVDVDRIREVHLSVGDPSPIPRRYCSATVRLSDGTRSTLRWVVASGAGFAAPGLAYATDEVEFCVAGHDPWRVHDGSCRTTRVWW